MEYASKHHWCVGKGFGKWIKPNYVVIDAETTGTDPLRHSLIQVAIIGADGSSCEWTFRPCPGKEIDPGALRVNGATIASLDAQEQGYFAGVASVRKWLDEYAANCGQKLILHGWNVDFDRRFLDAALYPTKAPYSYRVVDLHSKARMYFEDILGGDLGTDFYLRTCAEMLGIDPEPEPHSALEGAKVTAACFDRIDRNLSELKRILNR